MAVCYVHHYVQDIRDVARAVCLAAQALHASNVVHRDLRQTNVVCVSENHCMVIDLELAAVADQIVPDSVREECHTGRSIR
jgi:tRNA A-37 threonylcarbamoyl transferase component Bud32